MTLNFLVSTQPLSHAIVCPSLHSHQAQMRTTIALLFVYACLCSTLVYGGSKRKLSPKIIATKTREYVYANNPDGTRTPLMITDTDTRAETAQKRLELRNILEKKKLDTLIKQVGNMNVREPQPQRSGDDAVSETRLSHTDPGASSNRKKTKAKKKGRKSSNRS